MRLEGNVEVSNRLLATANVSGRRQSQRACLILARHSHTNPDIYMVLQTAQNKQGTVYKVQNNVETVFTRFVNEGKATIRIIEPPHDLIIQSDCVQLKSFLHVLKLGLTKQTDNGVLTLSHPINRSFSNTPNKTRVVIKSRAEYPIIKGFPRTVEVLICAGLERKSFDRQILRLQSLRVLDLSNNMLKKLPKEVGDLPNLTELYLASNHLGLGGFYKFWFWMNRPNIRRSLKLLDISNNRIRELPYQLRKLNSLVTLKAGENLITDLPQCISRMGTLKYLEVPKNQLRSLPGCMRHMRLDYIDVSDNPLNGSCRNYRWKPVLLLLISAAARAVMNARIHYDASIIPATLVTYLETADFCVCGKACFGSFLCERLVFSLTLIAKSVKRSGTLDVAFDCNFCSVECCDIYAPPRPFI